MMNVKNTLSLILVLLVFQMFSSAHAQVASPKIQSLDRDYTTFIQTFTANLETCSPQKHLSFTSDQIKGLTFKDIYLKLFLTGSDPAKGATCKKDAVIQCIFKDPAFRQQTLNLISNPSFYLEYPQLSNPQQLKIDFQNLFSQNQLI